MQQSESSVYLSQFLQCLLSNQRFPTFGLLHSDAKDLAEGEDLCRGASSDQRLQGEGGCPLSWG